MRLLLGLMALALCLGACDPSEPPRVPRGDAGTGDMGEADRDGGPPDTGVPDLGNDAGEPDLGAPDAGSPGAYLDRCNVPADCASGRCIDDRGATRFCTRTCITGGDCASDHLCAGGECVPSDVGALCDEAADCATNLCAGNPATGVGECSRECTNAADCPAGFACSDAGGALVCVDIERPCTQCATGICLEALGQGMRGCTSTCRGPADCPRTLPGLEYTCSGGHCIPSTFVLGPDPMGVSCRFSGGANLCRSGVCVDDDSGNSICTQVCSERGTCGEGFACVPSDDGAGGTVHICLDVVGDRDLQQGCATGPQCTSGICDGPRSTCTRLCTDDRLCPTGESCVPDVPSGGAFSTCSP